MDIQYNSGTSAGGTANQMRSFWYHDPVVGTLDINALINFNWTNGWQGAHYRFDFNLWNFPQNSHGLTAGQAQPNRLGPVSGHRGNGDISGQKTLQWPSLAPATVTMGKPKPIPPTRSTEVNFAFESGYFTVGSRGEVTIDFLFDGGYYQGELAMFSLEEMGTIELGSEAYIREAARRSLSHTSLGYVVISDQREAARFSGLLLGEGKDWNSGEYLGPKVWAPRKIQILLRIGTGFQWFQALRIRNKAINRGARISDAGG